MMNAPLQGFKESFDILQTGFVELGLNNEGTILWINKYGAEELGFESMANALGSSFAALLKSKEQWSQFLHESDKSAAAVNFIFDLEGKVFEGIFTIVESTASGVFKDITPYITELYHLEKRNQTILETAREGFWNITLEGKILEINKSLCNLLGYKTDELLGKSIFSLVDSEGEKAFEQALERRKMGLSDNYEITLHHKNGSFVYVIISASPKTDSSGKIEGEYAFVTDITDFKFTHNMLHTIAAFSNDITRSLAEKEAYEILELYLLSIRKGEEKINIVYFVNMDIDNNLVEEVINYNDSGLEKICRFPGFDKCIAYKHTGALLANDLSKNIRCLFEKFGAKSGSYYCIPIKIGGSEAGILHLYSKSGNFFTEDVKKTIDSLTTVFTPVITNIKLLEMNKRLALTDSLTGLFNRRYFEIFMDKHIAIASRNDQFLSLVMFDIDNFKSLNDAYGHDSGDLILKNISKTLNENIRSSDIGVRYGGEEFAVILPSTDKMSAFDVAEKIRNAIGETAVYITRGKRVFITASFGIATYGLDAISIDTLVAEADSALYDAKKSGKNRTCIA